MLKQTKIAAKSDGRKKGLHITHAYTLGNIRAALGYACNFQTQFPNWFGLQKYV